MKEYLETKKNIRDNLLSDRTGEQQLKTDLSKFYKPITETQKATASEITEGLRPIRESIENLQQAITFPPTQPVGEALKEASKEASTEEEGLQYVGETAKAYLNRPDPDRTFRIRKEKGLYYIGNKQATIAFNNIIIDDEKFEGTPGLCDLIMSKGPEIFKSSKEDGENYAKLMIKANALHRYYDPSNPHPRSSVSKKWDLLSDIWYNRRKYEGKGVVIPSDPNVLLE